jgi:hypothetical protein
MLKILRNLKFRDSFLFLFLIAVGAIVCYATVLIADYTTNLMASLNNYQTFKTLFNSGLIDDKFVGVYNGQTA